MNKRLICLLLSLIMLLSGCLVSCSEKTDEAAKDDIQEEASESTITLSMYLVSENKISEEQAAKIQAATNRITKAKFKTQLVLFFFTEDQYYTALDKAFQDTVDTKAAEEAARKALSDAIKRGEVTTAATTTGATTAEETIVNEYGVTELKYPTLKDNQVDIFYISSYDKLQEYIEKDWVSRLDEELSSSSKLLNTYISPNYLKYAKSLCNGTYAIPGNNVTGEYTYLLLNKEVLKKYHYMTDGVKADTSSFTSLTCDSCKELLANVKRYDSEHYVPLYSGTGELDVSNIRYWGIDENGNLSDSFSLFGGTYDPTMNYLQKDSYSGFSNIFTLSSFKNQVSSLLDYKINGYYGTESDAGKDFAVGYVKGGAELVEKYGEDYEFVVIESPKLETEDIFANMFAVGSFTSSVSRSMEIITYLNTNVDFRNLIQYGIEGENYELIESDKKDSNGNAYKTVRRLNGDYMMDVEKTGNVLIAYPLETELANIRYYNKLQNRDAKVSLIMGFTLKYNGMSVNLDIMNEARTESEKLYNQMMACQTQEELTAFFATAKSATSASVNERFAKMLDISYMEDSINVEKFGEGASFNAIYMKWLTDMKIYVDEEE